MSQTQDRSDCQGSFPCFFFALDRQLKRDDVLHDIAHEIEKLDLDALLDLFELNLLAFLALAIEGRV